MRYVQPEDIPGCQWPGCSNKAHRLLLNSDETDQAYVCPAHYRTAVMNLDLFDKVIVYRKQVSLAPGDAPVVPGQRRDDQSAPKPNVPGGEPDWAREAAQKADSAAVPVDEVAEPPKSVGIISRVPKPKEKRR